jgi:BirA family biotin operon repressor/biotin-[acetyl-CoA-carboxylase] ligase
VSAPQPRESWHLDTAHLGRVVHVFDQLDSTNTAAARLAAGGAEGIAVVADFQSAGRGQHGRVWHARPGSSLLLSVPLRPPAGLSRPVILTALAAVAVGDAILALTGAQAQIKWPNDLLVRGKKTCGILIENTGPTVIGIGLNLTQTAEEFTAAELPQATSLGIVSGRAIDARTAATTLLTRLDAEYDRLLRGERAGVEADWKWRIGLLGGRVAVELTDGTTVTGRLREMSFDGLELDTGGPVPRLLGPERIRHLSAG